MMGTDGINYSMRCSVHISQQEQLMLWILSIGGCPRSVPGKDIGYIGALPSTVTSVKVWILYLLTHPDGNLCWKS